MAQLVQSWRALWSASPRTTSPLAPFGVTTLANSGSEGHSNKMASMRWAQTSNYGHWDNKALPNTFGAQVGLATELAGPSHPVRTFPSN